MKAALRGFSLHLFKRRAEVSVNSPLRAEATSLGSRPKISKMKRLPPTSEPVTTSAFSRINCSSPSKRVEGREASTNRS